MQTEVSPARRALGIAFPLVAVGVVVSLRPEILTGTFSSVTSALRVALLVAAWLAFSWLMRRFVEPPALRYAVVGVVGAGLLAVTVLPYFQEKKVDDELATAAPAATTVLTEEAPAPRPSGPEKVASGQLRGLAGHRGAGEAAIYRQPDGSYLVRLVDFDVSNVPAPVLYLLPGAGRENPGGLKLGGLRGSQGNQNFSVPAGTAVNAPQTVLIWCEAFSVPVAAATAAAG